MSMLYLLLCWYEVVLLCWYEVVTSVHEPSQDRETYKFSTLSKVMRELLEWRRQLLTGTLTQDHMREFKLKITSKIDWGNR
uniref:Dedicator of cytokinesis N-terminal domain-containing protein n=1 Tax=Timema tahoe TaxID=61484 RepID=A0A7R9IM66_9NEOP|nr:unnamed protein product [Timema tahoe]